MNTATETVRHPPAASLDWDSDVRVLAPGTLGGRRAVVTGAGTGIGRGIALRLVELGAGVVGLGRRPEKLRETEAITRDLPGSFRWASVDVRDTEAARKAFAAASEQGLDLLVNNAGGQFYAGIADLSDRGFRSVVDLNLNAVFTAVSACLPGLSQRGGSIVSMSLSGVDRGSAGIGHSLAARAGVLALTRTIALEWAHLGIRANCIGPGAVLTSELPPEVTADMANRLVPTAVPAGRATPVEDIAETVAFLASPAGRMLSGQMLQVDGAAQLGAGLHMLDSWPPGQPS
ncbi:SDR family oxidoreductase [Streptomyces hygroscopicus]|uniref:SDR family oxidoreductase n=1 Tax=Streptomyces hygroscopicus TaxID=1912 RepID=UPI003625D887